jgi:hypothetical protein
MFYTVALNYVGLDRKQFVNPLKPNGNYMNHML